ncbi:MAG: LD-carboxypeptidase [Thermoplasmata archaeon]
MKPAKLEKRATIGIASPSGFSEPFGLGQAVDYLKELGYKVVLGECTRNLTRSHFSSGKDEARARELTAMFDDDKVDAIFCSRGGYGAMRILDLLDFGVIKDNPKIFMGYSDITTLHVAIHQRTGLVTFHGPSIEGYAGDNAEKDPPSGKDNIDRAISLLSKAEPWGRLDNPPRGMLLRTVVPGKARGRTIGGNLTMLTHTLGTADSVRTDGRLLFVEDVYVSEYDIDRLLTHLSLARKLQKAAGIVFGQVSSFTKREMPGPSLEEVIQDRIGALKGVPSFTGLCCGHGAMKLVVPEGVMASMDATEPSLRIDESPLKG